MNKNRILYKYILYDMIASLLVWISFVVFRKTVNDIPIYNGFLVLISSSSYIFSLLSFPFFCIFIHYLTGFYINSVRKPRVNLILETLVSAIIISFLIFFIIKLGDVVVSYRYFYFSLLVLFGLQFLFTFLFRNRIYNQIQTDFKSKKLTINTLIVGTGINAKKIAADMQKFSYHNTILGFINVNNKGSEISSELVLGNLSHVGSIIQKHQIEEVIVVLDNSDDQQLFEIINLLYKFNVEIRFTPRLYEILTGSAKISKVEISPLVSITQPTIPEWEACVKRFFDIIISVLAIVILSPFLLYCVIMIKSDSKGPAFFRQERIGRHGRKFNILKFRSMHVGAENGVPKLSSTNDNRITRVGKILRKYRIDELPQLWNILKGDMSIVGPRPERSYYINQIIEEAPYYCLLYKIRPGLTSWGPIKIGYSDSIEKMIERLNYDIIYLENMSLLNDLKILILTTEIIFKGKGV